jgi:hypothetical protein
LFKVTDKCARSSRTESVDFQIAWGGASIKPQSGASAKRGFTAFKEELEWLPISKDGRCFAVASEPQRLEIELCVGICGDQIEIRGVRSTCQLCPLSVGDRIGDDGGSGSDDGNENGANHGKRVRHLEVMDDDCEPSVDYIGPFDEGFCSGSDTNTVVC